MVEEKKHMGKSNYRRVFPECSTAPPRRSRQFAAAAVRAYSWRATHAASAHLVRRQTRLLGRGGVPANTSAVAIRARTPIMWYMYELSTVDGRCRWGAADP